MLETKFTPHDCGERCKGRLVVGVISRSKAKITNLHTFSQVAKFTTTGDCCCHNCDCRCSSS